MYNQDVLKKIGNTPLVELKKVNPNYRTKIMAKLEGFNPTGSIKDRIALAMVEKAEKSGLLTKDKTIIEPTSGNTGISLAMVCAIKGYKLKIIMPESMSVERRKMIKAFGAELILIRQEDWRGAAVNATKQLLEQDPDLFMLNQFENEANRTIHYETTGQEILDQMNGEKIDYFVAGLGTGGTISGVAKKIKEKFPEVKVIGLQPVLGQKIEGLRSLKEGYTPPVMDLKLIDEIMEVSEQEAFSALRDLAKKEGIFAGPSSGAALFVSLKIAEKIPEGNIITIFPDRGEKYLSTEAFNN